MLSSTMPTRTRPVLPSRIHRAASPSGQEVARLALGQRLVRSACADHHRHLRCAGARHRLGEERRRSLLGTLAEDLPQELLGHPGGAEGGPGDDAGRPVVGTFRNAGVAQRELHRRHRHPRRRAHAPGECRRDELAELREVGERGESRSAGPVEARAAVDLAEARHTRPEPLEQRRAAGAEGAEDPQTR